MFCYCLNNPVNMVDSDGREALTVAKELLLHWIIGNGEPIKYDYYDDFILKFQRSRTMKLEINRQIKLNVNGADNLDGSIIFTPPDIDLWLGVRKADYKMTLVKETKTTGFWFFKKEKSRYKATITISDIYNFDTGNEKGDGIGSWLNNVGFWAQSHKLGTSYHWSVTFDVWTRWE